LTLLQQKILVTEAVVKTEKETEETETERDLAVTGGRDPEVGIGKEGDVAAGKKKKADAKVEKRNVFDHLREKETPSLVAHLQTGLATISNSTTKPVHLKKSHNEVVRSQNAPSPQASQHREMQVYPTNCGLMD
jgi:hypothetical protein